MIKRAMWTMALLLGAGAVPVWAAQGPMRPARLVQLQKAHQAPLLVDVRTPHEYREGHIAGALNVPVSQVAARYGALHARRDQPIIVYCHSGRRAARAKATLDRLGFTHVRLLKGSMMGWRARQLPVVHESAH
ncbi:rhodanese-like domain-containing protein [Oleiagrimonas sp. C23AA]|uniref:rhodanese-like domain-containing protein n=1 Tax=Oleiagrimonas sp. C23AA TaxID=2719047 RepID=UPI00141D762E|nr:rhodanese-like domain-containing protein [Oleiagrimonas sp. C23AA]NII11871.1 rhodanese-like domain-containing protein [Oleiagrimonas sp. C23AA]